MAKVLHHISIFLFFTEISVLLKILAWLSFYYKPPLNRCRFKKSISHPWNRMSSLKLKACKTDQNRINTWTGRDTRDEKPEDSSWESVLLDTCSQHGDSSIDGLWGEATWVSEDCLVESLARQEALTCPVTKRINRVLTSSPDTGAKKRNLMLYYRPD